jgi:hypothetical protein
MLKLLPGHPEASIYAIALSALQHRKGSPNANDTGWSGSENAQTGIELCGVSQYEVEDDLEVGRDNAREG